MKNIVLKPVSENELRKMEEKRNAQGRCAQGRC